MSPTNTVTYFSIPSSSIYHHYHCNLTPIRAVAAIPRRQSPHLQSLLLTGLLLLHNKYATLINSPLELRCINSVEKYPFSNTLVNWIGQQIMTELNIVHRHGLIRTSLLSYRLMFQVSSEFLENIILLLYKLRSHNDKTRGATDSHQRDAVTVTHPVYIL